MMSWLTLLTPRLISWEFHVDICIRSASLLRILHGGTYRTLMVPDRILGWHIIFDFLDDLVWPKGQYPESFMLICLLEVCQEWGVKKRGTWRTLRVPDRTLGWQGHPWCHGWPYFTQRKIPWKFHVYIFIRSVSRMRGQEWGYMEDCLLYTSPSPRD